ncbi:MAG: FemAB family PEP-CTERM system-associated protein [Planctomycetes bacterium]|nr:FemAB family PEP-CTERM system-associated protein [Planctomycetota bacterium]
MSSTESPELSAAPVATPPTVEIRLGSPADDAERDAFVRSHPDGTFFHLSGWRRAVENAMGHEPNDFVARRAGQIVGVLPLMRAPRWITGNALISMPYAVYGGALGVEREIEHALVRAAMAEADRIGAGRLELRCQRDPGLELAKSELYATFIKDLPDAPEKVLAQMPKKSRAEARKAREKHGLKLTEGKWYLDDFFQLFHRNKRSLGSPGLPHVFFWSLCKEFGDEVRLHVVHRGNEPVSAVMSFLFRGDVLAYYSGTRDGADRECSASNFMYMALQEWSVAQGFRRFDFGRSRKDSGAFTFKEHQGFTGADLQYRFYLARDKHLPSLNPSNPKTKVLRDTWAKLPLRLTTVLSNELARYLP